MNIRNLYLKLKKSKNKREDIKSFFEGNIRYWLWYHARWMIRKHIREQIAYRIRVMNPSCYTDGICHVCGCETIALQMCSKECAGMCYPQLLGRYEWSQKPPIYIRGMRLMWNWNFLKDRYELFNEETGAKISCL